MFTKFMQLILTINFAHRENTEYGKITLIMVQLNVLVSRRQNDKEKIVLFYFIGVTQSNSTTLTLWMWINVGTYYTANERKIKHQIFENVPVEDQLNRNMFGV